MMNEILRTLCIISVLWVAATAASVRKDWTQATTLEEATHEPPGTTIHNVPTVDAPVRTADTVHPIPHGPWSQEDIGDPRVDVWACGNGGNRSHVCNPDRVLTREEGDD
jgi:hypothetical protein